MPLSLTRLAVFSVFGLQLGNPGVSFENSCDLVTTMAKSKILHFSYPSRSRFSPPFGFDAAFHGSGWATPLCQAGSQQGSMRRALLEKKLLEKMLF